MTRKQKRKGACIPPSQYNDTTRRNEKKTTHSSKTPCQSIFASRTMSGVSSTVIIFPGFLPRSSPFHFVYLSALWLQTRSEKVFYALQVTPPIPPLHFPLLFLHPFTATLLTLKTLPKHKRHRHCTLATHPECSIHSYANGRASSSAHLSLNRARCPLLCPQSL